jgi:Fis family transcriptional regulator
MGMYMNTIELLAIDREKTVDNQNQPLRECVKHALENYFTHLEGHVPANLYDLVLEEVESPLLEAVMKYVKGNQCKAAILLGISRGTLRKKLKMYNLEK